jgi:hypothetical protein
MTRESQRRRVFRIGRAPGFEVNVFRRFSSDRSEAMRAFYGEVLGLVPLPSSMQTAPATLLFEVDLLELR